MLDKIYGEQIPNNIHFVEIPSLYDIPFYLIVAIKLEKQGTMIATS
jgi:hypothetical protein